MGLDIKFPIGLLFTILGVILTIFGVVTTNDVLMYTKSLGQNINIYTGLLMLVFGLIMLYFSRQTKKNKDQQV